MTDPNHIAEARKKVSRPQIREAFLRNGARIEPDRDDLPDYVYEAAFELLEMAAPAVQGEPVAEEVTLFECVSCNHLYQDQVTRCDCMPEEQKFKRWLARPERTEQQIAVWSRDPKRQSVLNLSEAARSLGVAQEKGDQGAIEYWGAMVARFEMEVIQPAEQQPDVAQLVEALDKVMHCRQFELLPGSVQHGVSAALAPYRKGGDA